MKKLVLCLIMLGCVSCAPFNVKISMFESNDYILGSTSTSSNKVWSISSDEIKAYGNGNYVYVDQMINMYKSPTTNSSNSVPLTVPLMGW